MATNTSNTVLTYSTTSNGTYNKLCDIVSYPDLGSAPSKLDTTDLTQTANKTSILGLADAPDLTFDCNYDETAFNTINTLGTTTIYFFRLSFGTNDGKFEWSGQVRVFANGGGVDEVRKMTVITSAATPVTFATT